MPSLSYDWHVTVRDDAFQDAEGAPTAGPPPFDVYVVTPTVAFGFGTGAENFNHPTRWRFAHQKDGEVRSTVERAEWRSIGDAILDHTGRSSRWQQR